MGKVKVRTVGQVFPEGKTKKERRSNVEQMKGNIKFGPLTLRIRPDKTGQFANIKISLDEAEHYDKHTAGPVIMNKFYDQARAFSLKGGAH